MHMNVLIALSLCFGFSYLGVADSIVFTDIKGEPQKAFAPLKALTVECNAEKDLLLVSVTDRKQSWQMELELEGIQQKGLSGNWFDRCLLDGDAGSA